MDMKLNRKKQKKPYTKSAFKTVLWILLVLVLIVLLAAAALFFYCKTVPTTKDDIAAATVETVPAQERYSFDASSLNMKMAVNKHDLLCLLKQAGVEDQLANAAAELNNYGFALQSYGVDLTDNGILVSAELNYGDSIRLPVKILADASVQDETLTLSLSKAYLGGIRLPLEILPLAWLAPDLAAEPGQSLANLKYDVDISGWDLQPMLSDVSFEKERMVLSFQLDETLFAPAVGFSGTYLDWFADDCPDCVEVLREYKLDGKVGNRFKALVEGFQKNPESFSRFVAEALAVSSPSVAQEYTSKNKPWFVCFLPEITDKRIEEMHDALYKRCEERSTEFDNLLVNLQTAYNSRLFKLDKRGVVYKNGPFDLTSYLGEDWAKYDGWLDPASFRLVLIDSEKAWNADTPALRQITDSVAYIDNVESLTSKLPLGFIVKMKDGTPVLKYNKAIADQNTVTVLNESVILDTALYDSMMKNPLIPVWKNGMAQ